MTTFSQVVDDMVLELLRPDLRASITTYVNQTVREVHFKPNIAAPILFDANRVEDVLNINTDSPWLWDLPSATRFMDIEALYINELARYADRKNPRLAKEASFEPFADIFWYRSGTQIAVSGVSNGQTANISYFMFPQIHAYQLAGVTRIVLYDPVLDTYTLNPSGVPNQVQMDAATNWVIQRWPDVIREGVRAKVWKRIGDEGRARMAYSAYESFRNGLWLAEPAS
jgi:hypothetical protein